MIRANYRMHSNFNVRADHKSGLALSHAEPKMSRQGRFILTALIHGAWGGDFTTVSEQNSLFLDPQNEE